MTITISNEFMWGFVTALGIFALWILYIGFIWKGKSYG